MQDTITRHLNAMINTADRGAVKTPIVAGCNLDASQMLQPAALAIAAAGSPTVKTGALAYAIANGVLLKLAAGTTLPALNGTVANAAFNVYVFYVDQNGNLATQIGTAGNTLATLKFPQPPLGQAMIGFVIVNPTGAGNFIGGTTNLDDATVIPNAVYISATGGFDPTILIS